MQILGDFAGMIMSFRGSCLGLIGRQNVGNEVHPHRYCPIRLIGGVPGFFAQHRIQTQDPVFGVEQGSATAPPPAISAS